MDEVTNYELAKVYRYLNDLDKDIKQLRDEIKELRDEIKELKADKHENNNKCSRDPHHCKYFKSYWDCGLFRGKCLNFIDYLSGRNYNG